MKIEFEVPDGCEVVVIGIKSHHGHIAIMNKFDVLLAGKVEDGIWWPEIKNHDSIQSAIDANAKWLKGEE